MSESVKAGRSLSTVMIIVLTIKQTHASLQPFIFKTLHLVQQIFIQIGSFSREYFCRTVWAHQSCPSGFYQRVLNTAPSSDLDFSLQIFDLTISKINIDFRRRSLA